MGNFRVVPLVHSVCDMFLKTHTNDNTECLLRGTNSNYTYYLDSFMLQYVRHHLDDPGEDGRIILRCIFRKCDGGMDWIDLA